MRPGADCHAARVRMEEVLSEDYGLTHTTLQVDHVGEDLLQVGRRGDGHCAQSHGPIHRATPHTH